MQVTVRCFATLRKYHLAQERVELNDGSTVADLLGRAGIPPSEVAVALVDGRHVEWDRPLHDGETLALFPPIAGG